VATTGSTTLAPPGAARSPNAAPLNRSEVSWLMWPPIAFFVIALGVPMGELFVQAVRGDNAFVGAFKTQLFLASLGRTAVLAVIVTVLVVVLGTIYAVGISTAPRWLRVVLLGALLLSLWTSTLVRTFGWELMEIPQGALYWLLHSVGLTDQPVTLYQTTIGMYPAMVSVMLPFAVLPVLAAVGSLDRDQLSAATIFGAGPMLTLRKVILPHVSSGITTASVLVFVLSLGFYVTPVLLGGPANQTVSGVINLQLAAANRPDLGAAMSLVLVAATLIVYLTADRLFRVSEKWG
jgi:putative spermidine/putrescine transport system permease protein